MVVSTVKPEKQEVQVFTVAEHCAQLGLQGMHFPDIEVEPLWQLVTQSPF